MESTPALEIGKVNVLDIDALHYWASKWGFFCLFDGEQVWMARMPTHAEQEVIARARRAGN